MDSQRLVGAPTVFLSYAHDDDLHRSAVLEFAIFLETRGIAVTFDLWHDDVRLDWYAWMLREIQAADFVIVVASPGYRAVGDGAAAGAAHRGVQAETAVLRDLLYRDRATWLRRVLPVVLPGSSPDDLPTFTQPHSASHFIVESLTDPGAESLMRTLTGRPRHIRPPRGRRAGVPSRQKPVVVTRRLTAPMQKANRANVTIASHFPGSLDFPGQTRFQHRP